MFQYKKGYWALSFHINLWISCHLALIMHDATYVVNSSIINKTDHIFKTWNHSLRSWVHFRFGLVITSFFWMVCESADDEKSSCGWCFKVSCRLPLWHRRARIELFYGVRYITIARSWCSTSNGFLHARRKTEWTKWHELLCGWG